MPPSRPSAYLPSPLEVRRLLPGLLGTTQLPDLSLPASLLTVPIALRGVPWLTPASTPSSPRPPTSHSRRSTCFTLLGVPWPVSVSPPTRLPLPSVKLQVRP